MWKNKIVYSSLISIPVKGIHHLLKNLYAWKGVKYCCGYMWNAYRMPPLLLTTNQVCEPAGKLWNWRVKGDLYWPQSLGQKLMLEIKIKLGCTCTEYEGRSKSVAFVIQKRWGMGLGMEFTRRYIREYRHTWAPKWNYTILIYIHIYIYIYIYIYIHST